ncbi:MAG: hypothetical protein KIT62_08675 [Cyclobacteriaceae bacterium]|nr:hypothetical protein [Cyclobacteriaceae bacterium]
MCENDESPFQVLAECREGYIGLCSCCGELNFVYKNLLLTFQEAEFHHFFEWWFDQCDRQHYHITLLNGKTHFFTGPVPNMFLVYTKDELEEIKHLYTEVKLALDARRIINVPS